MKTVDRILRTILIALLVLCVCISPALASTAESDFHIKPGPDVFCSDTEVIYGWQKYLLSSLDPYINCFGKAISNLLSNDVFYRVYPSKEDYEDGQITPYEEDGPIENGLNDVPETLEYYTESDSPEYVFAVEVIRLLNAERTAAGLSPLMENQLLDQAASVRCSEIMTAFSHTRPDGRSCFTALQEAGAVYGRAGENIAIGQSTPAQVVQAWMESPGHRANIMNEGFRYIGVSARPSNGDYGGYAWVQVFTD